MLHVDEGAVFPFLLRMRDAPKDGSRLSRARFPVDFRDVPDGIAAARYIVEAQEPSRKHRLLCKEDGRKAGTFRQVVKNPHNKTSESVEFCNMLRCKHGKVAVVRNHVLVNLAEAHHDDARSS